MGLFDGAAPREARLTPGLALGGALVFIAAAEGDVNDDAIGHMARVLRTDVLFQSSVQYAARHSFEAFIAEAARTLDPAQRLCVFLNVVDLVTLRGAPGIDEETRLRQLIEAFELSEETLRPAIETLIAKNNISALGL